MPGLRDILNAARSEGKTIREVAARIEAQEWLEDRAPELAALALDEADRNPEFAARLDQLGKEQTDG